MRYSSTLLNQCILGVTLNFDLSMSLKTLMCGQKCLVRIYDRYLASLIAEIIVFNEKRPCFIVGYLVVMETHVTLFVLMHFCKVYGIGAINVCTNFDINPYKIYEFRKHAT